MNAAELLTQLAEIANGTLECARSAEPALYWNEDIASIEEKAVFRHDWLCPGLAAEIPNPGDYMTFTVAGDPIFTIRTRDGTITTRWNGAA